MSQKWEKGCTVWCPACSNQYDTDDHMPFTPAEYDKAAKAIRLYKKVRGHFDALVRFIENHEGLEGEGGPVDAFVKHARRAKAAIKRAEAGGP